MTPAPRPAGEVTEVNGRRCFALALAVLAAATVLRFLEAAGPTWVWTSLMTAALVLVARTCGASFDDLGLHPPHGGRGLRYGGGAAGVVLLVLVAVAVLPATSGTLQDARGEISAGRLVYELVVDVLLLTAIPEEFAFRGVLLGSATAEWGPLPATLVTSGAFGLWHVQPTLATMTGNAAVSGASASPGGRFLVVLGAVLVTFAGGLVFAWLRLRSRSLVAPVLAHAATNGLGLAAAWLAVH